MSKTKKKIIAFIVISVFWIVYYKTNIEKNKKIKLNENPVLLKKCAQYVNNVQFAPDELYNKKNPHNSKEDIIIGGEIFNRKARPLPCKDCHGKDGKGHVPYKITCEEIKDKITPGQMFWSMKNNISNTGLAEHKRILSDTELWQVVAYIESEIAGR